MAQFSVLKGKNISKAIAGFGAKAATFSALVHQIAYSALDHVEQHHDACYVQQFYDAAPVNYRAMLVNWFTNFGRVTFDAKALTFTYAKSKASDMDGAMAVSPADFQKEKKGGASEKTDTQEKVLASAITRLEAIREKGGKVDPRVIQAIKGALAIVEGKADAKPTLIKAEKPAKAKKAAKAAPATETPEAVAA